jgi:F-type H+-transporting ATPase subunit b
MLEFGPTLFIQIVNFVFLLLILKAFLWKPLMETLEKRQKHIESQIKEAEGINEEARDLKAR